MFHIVAIFYSTPTPYSNTIWPLIGNGTIDRYPPGRELTLEKLLIFTKEIFKSLQGEIEKLSPKKTLQRKLKNNERIPKISIQPASHPNTVRNYEPTKIHPAYDGNLWRWRRAYDWFNQISLDDRQGTSLENILKSLE